MILQSYVSSYVHPLHWIKSKICAPRSFQQKLIHHFRVSMYSISPKAIYDIFAMHGRGSTTRKFKTIDISFTEPVERALFIFLWGECCFMILAPIFKPFLKIRVSDLVFTQRLGIEHMEILKYKLWERIDTR